jgi:CHAT domain-containing protein/Flp pilus assembly protein TadD
MAAPKKSYPMPYGTPGKVFISFDKLKFALIAIVFLIIAIFAVFVIRGTALQRGNAALVRAFSSKRLIEPRLSGAFKAAPFAPNNSGETLDGNSDLHLANSLIQDAVITNDPYAHLAYGRLLVAKNTKGSDGLRHLRIAVKDLGGKPEPHNDLGVCLMQREKIDDAVEEFDAALSLDSAMPEALFNRALCYQRLQLNEAARADLSRLASIERDPLWRAEVEARLKELSSSIKKPRTEPETIADLKQALNTNDDDAARAIVRSYYDRVQRHVQTLVKEHLQASVNNESQTAELSLSWIEKLAEMGVTLKGDYSLASYSKYLRSMPRSEKKKELEILDKYIEAGKKQMARKYGEALPEFERLRGIFKERRNYLYELRAKHFIGRAQHHSNFLTASIKTLTECLTVAEQNGWRFDYTRLLPNLGLSYSRLGQDSTALKLYEDNLQLNRRMNDSEAKPKQLIGMAYWHLGNLETALNNLQESTNLFLTANPDPFELANNYLNIADIYRLSAKHSLALLFAREALRIADEAPDNNRAAQACSFIALEEANLNQFDAADASFKAAFAYRDKLSASEREYTEPLIYIRAGEAAVRKGSTASAVEYYSKAETLAGNTEGNIIPHINALRGRAEAEETAGETEKARDDLQSAIKRIEDYRKGLKERDHRVEFLDASQSVYDQLVELEMDSPNRAPQAFEMSEQSRARALLDDILDPERARKEVKESKLLKIKEDRVNFSAPETMLNLAQIQAALPKGVTLLVYSVTNQRIFTFLISHTDFKTVESNTPSAKLARLVGDYVSDIKAERPIPGLKEKASELYKLLIAPMAHLLPKDETICVVPDKSLHFLPFHTLCDASGNYIIQNYSVTYAPSASVLIRCIQMDKVKALIGPEQYFAVGNPKFNSEQFTYLEDLKDAKNEAIESARTYINSHVLVDSGATEIEVRKAMKQCNVAHFALHCLVQEQSPWKAALVLAPGPAGDSHSPTKGDTNLPHSDSSGGRAKTKGRFQSLAFSPNIEVSEDNPNDGLLSLKEIYNLSLPHMRLVVLSACQTGIGQFYRGEGIVSLIHPFISARVSTVVASLWPVNSEATTYLMIDFHKERHKPNISSGDALRAAQLRMIEKGDFAHPYNWASFIVVGGNY